MFTANHKRTTLNRILRSTVSSLNLGLFALYCILKLKQELAA